MFSVSPPLRTPCGILSVGALAVAVVLGACAESEADADLYTLTVTEEGYDITLTEVERTPSSSLVEWTQNESPTVTASGVVMMRGATDIALERGFSHLFVAPAAEQPPNGPNRLTILFTNDEATPLSDVAGPAHSAAMQASFDRRGWIPVDGMAQFFGIR